MAVVAGSVDVEVVGTDEGHICEGGVRFPHKTLWYYRLVGEIGESRCEGLREIRDTAGSRDVGGRRICVGEVTGGGGQKALLGDPEWRKSVRSGYPLAARKTY